MTQTDGKQSFKAAPVRLAGGAIFLPLPFDPDIVWGKRPRHHVNGFVAACKVRGPLAVHEGKQGLRLGRPGSATIHLSPAPPSK